MQTPTYYAPVSADIRNDKNLNLFQKLLYAEIIALSNRSGYCWATNKFFTEKYDVAISTISRALRVLEDSGHIKIEIDKSKGNKRKIFVLGIGTTTESRIKRKKKVRKKSTEQRPRDYKQSAHSYKQSAQSYKNNKYNNKKNSSSKDEDNETTFRWRNKSKRRLPKILLKPKSDPKIKLKYSLSIEDRQLFNELVELGAIKHRPGTAAYNYTFNQIHSLLKPSCICPYIDQRHIDKEYLEKKWTFDEIVEVYKFMKANTNKPWTNIGKFIWHKPFNGDGWSPLVQYHKKMRKESGEFMNEGSKKLLNGLHKLNITTLNSKEISRIHTLLNLYVNGYQVSDSLKHIYVNGMTSVFVSYVKKQMRNRKFKPAYMLGENFMISFIDDVTSNGIIKKGNSHAYY